MKDFCTFYLKNFLFGIEVSQVREIVRFDSVTPVPLAEKCIKGLMNLRGEILTVLNLSQRLGINSDSSLLQRGKLTTVSNDTEQFYIVVQAGEENVSFLVDDVSDVITVNEEFSESPPSTIPFSQRRYISKVYKLQNTLLLALSPEKVVLYADK